MSTNRELPAIILGRVSETLKPHGFKKSGSTFTRDVGEVVHLINIQKSSSNDAQHVKCTANVAVWVKALAPVRVGVPDRPDVWSAHWRVRIGRDSWWSAATAAEASAAAEVIAEALARTALPELEKLRSASALVDLWKTGDAPGLTATERDRYLGKMATDLA